MEIKLLVDGGAMKPGPALSQKMGPLGMNMGKIIADINKATHEFQGMKVPVVLDINTKTKTYNVIVSTPPVSALLKKEISLEKGSPEPNNIKAGNMAIEQIIKIAKIKEKDMSVNDLKKAVSVVLGTCVSLGLLVESKDPREVIREVEKGDYNDLISKGIENPSPEKLEKLAKDFEKTKKGQEAYIQSLEAKKEAKTAVAVPAEGAAATAAPAAAPAAKPEAKKEEKKKK